MRSGAAPRARRAAVFPVTAGNHDPDGCLDGVRRWAYGARMALRAGHIRIGPERGRLLVRTSRQGLAATAGHDLTIEVTSWSADVAVDGDSAAVSGRADLASIAVREGTGGVKPLTDRDRREIADRARTLLDTDHRPEAAFRSTEVPVTDSGGTITGTLTIRGIDQPFTLEVGQTRPGHYRATGTVVQSAYGIKPYTAFFGALKLADEVTIEIETELDEDHHAA